MSYDNVKFLLKDKNGKYLVGRKLDSLIPYSALGGKRDSGEKKPIQTLNRELIEESSNVLTLYQQNNKLYLIAFINDKTYPYEISNYETKNVNQQVYFLMSTKDDLSKKVPIWNEMFKINQNKIIKNEFESLRNVLPERISNSQIYEWIYRFRNNYNSPKLKLILHNLDFKEKDIKLIINFLQGNGYYLEMDGLELVSQDQLVKGLFEKGIFLVEDENFKDFFRK